MGMARRVLWTLKSRLAGLRRISSAACYPDFSSRDWLCQKLFLSGRTEWLVLKIQFSGTTYPHRFVPLATLGFHPQPLPNDNRHNGCELEVILESTTLGLLLLGGLALLRRGGQPEPPSEGVRYNLDHRWLGCSPRCVLERQSVPQQVMVLAEAEPVLLLALPDQATNHNPWVEV